MSNVISHIDCDYIAAKQECYKYMNQCSSICNIVENYNTRCQFEPSESNFTSEKLTFCLIICL